MPAHEEDLLSFISPRPFVQADRSFVLSSFESSYWHSDSHHGLRGPDFHRVVVLPFERVLSLHPPTCFAFNDDPDDLVGWSLASTDSLFYFFVKPRYRRRGLGSHLLARSPRPLNLVFLTPAARRLLRHHNLSYTLSPYLLLV